MFWPRPRPTVVSDSALKEASACLCLPVLPPDKHLVPRTEPPRLHKAAPRALLPPPTGAVNRRFERTGQSLFVHSTATRVCGCSAPREIAIVPLRKAGPERRGRLFIILFCRRSRCQLLIKIASFLGSLAKEARPLVYGLWFICWSSLLRRIERIP